MRLMIFTTGGSIDKGYSTKVSEFVVGEPQIAAILRDANVNLRYEVESLLKKDSLQISDEDREMIVERVKGTPHRHIIITHGTDTMTVTAKALQGIPDKVVVLTGALQPAAFKVTDAIFNVGCAVAAVQILPPGVYIAMSGRVFDAAKAQKNTEIDQFEEITC